MKDYYYLAIDRHMKRVTNLSKTVKKSESERELVNTNK